MTLFVTFPDTFKRSVYTHGRQCTRPRVRA